MQACEAPLLAGVVCPEFLPQPYLKSRKIAVRASHIWQLKAQRTLSPCPTSDIVASTAWWPRHQVFRQQLR